MVKEEHLRYNVFSPQSCDRFEAASLNRSYEFWKNFWSAIYKSSNSEHELKIDDFFRQNYICVLTDKETPVAMHLYSLFDLNLSCVTEHSYFEFYSKSFIETLKNRNCNRVMSMEYFTVNPDYRSSKSGISFGRVMLSLGLKLFSNTIADAAIGPARTDVNAHKMSYEVGFDCIEANTLQRGFNCDLVACFQGRQKMSENKEVNNMVKFLWNKYLGNQNSNNLAA